MARYDYWISEEGLLRLQDWARNGLTDKQIADNIGINVSTLYEWKKKYKELSDTLKKGKEVVDIQVENALLKKAIGGMYEERVIKEGIEVQKVIKEIPPDTTALIFWLKNRRPDKWRNKIVDTELNEDETGVIEIIKQEDIDGDST